MKNRDRNQVGIVELEPACRYWEDLGKHWIVD